MGKIILVFSIILGLLFSWRINRNKNHKTGCLVFGYTTLVAFLISCFALFLTYFLSNSFLESIDTYRNGEKCIATIESYSSYISKDSDGKRTTMYTPTYNIQTNDGIIHLVKDSVSSGKEPKVGDTLELYYNEATGKIFSWRASTFIMFIGVFFMWFILAFAFVGFIMYTLGFSLDKYYKILQKIGMTFLVPALMIAFEALLIYALFYGNKVPLAITIILGFFILVLGLGIIGHIKNIIKRGLPKWERTSPTSWSAGWDEVEEVDSDDETSIDNKREINGNYTKKY